MLLLLCAVLTLCRISLATPFNGSCAAPNDGTANAPSPLDGFLEANSTGFANFTVPKITGDTPWHLFLALKDNGGQEIGMWLAIPKQAFGNDSQQYMHLCAYALDGAFGSPKAGTGNETCDGLVSDNCTEGIFRSVDFGPTGDCTARGLDQYCNTQSWHASSIKLSKGMSCLETSLPGADVPEGYTVASLGAARTMSTVDNGHEAYDSLVQTARPLVLEFVEYTDLGPYSYTADLVEAQRICAAPNEVRKGSRLPSDDENSMGQSMRQNGCGPLLLAVALAATMLAIV